MNTEGFNAFILGQPLASSVGQGDLFPIVQAGMTKGVPPILLQGNVTNDQSSGPYAIQGTDLDKWIEVGAFSYTLPAASTFPVGWKTLLVNVATSGNATLNTTTSVFKGAGGTSSLTIDPQYWAIVVGDGTNWVTIIR